MLLKSSYIGDFIKNSILLLGLLGSLGTYAQIKKDEPKKEKDSLSIFEKVNTLPEIVVKSKTLARKIKEGPVAVEVLELEPILSKTGSLLDVMIRVPGVNARSDGAIGDPVNFAINGLDKKSIVLFKDGIPMDFYGHSFEPGHVSASMFERIEVYKGVLPIGLGADALGGGINFITRKTKHKSLDVSAETGSFNTQRYTLNTFLPIKSGLYAGANVSYVQSDNNWYVDVGREESKGLANYIYDGTVKTRLKNNGVNMYSGEYFIGIQDKKWAEDLRITVINSWLYKRINHIMGHRFVSGAEALYAYADDRTISGVISYKGKFFKDKLKTDIIAGYGKTHIIAKDTANVITNRFGDIVRIHKSDHHPWYENGELYGMDLSLDYTLKSFRGNASYEVLPGQSLQVNHTYTSYDRIGRDSIGGRAISKHPDNYNKIIDVYTYPAIYQKSVSAVGWEGHFFDKKLESVLAYKHYRRAMSGYSTIPKLGDDAKIYDRSSKHNGWVAGLSYRPNANWTFKTSFEHTLRMPDALEIFGNAQGIRTNFYIEPERSKNFNIEAQYRSTKTGTGAFMIGTNLFYRRTKDLIYLQPDIPFSYYKNADQGIGIYARGLDLDIYYQPFKFLTVGGNAMYMDRRLIKGDGETYPERLGDLSPLMANLNLTFHYDDWLQKGSRLELYWYWNYTHRYSVMPFMFQKGGIFDDLEDHYKNVRGVYEDWVPHDGSLGQSFMTQGITYTLANPKLSISLECRNVTDVVIYNNWRNQGPGRSYSVKLRWQLDFSKKTN